MKKLSIALAALAIMAIRPAMADRIIFAPTGSTLNPGQVNAEAAMSPSNDDNKIVWAGVGMQRFELSSIKFGNKADVMGIRDVTIVNGQLALLPETTLTPGIGVGVWDVTDKGPDGRGYFIAASKLVPLTKMPVLVHGLRVHAGIGVQGIDGVFGGAELAGPFGLQLAGEYFQKKVNLSLGWKPTSALQLKAYQLDEDIYYGIQFNSPF